MGPKVQSIKYCFRGRYMQSDWRNIMLKDESLTELQSRVLQHGPASLADAYVLGALHQRYLRDRGGSADSPEASPPSLP